MTSDIRTVWLAVVMLALSSCVTAHRTNPRSFAIAYTEIEALYIASNLSSCHVSINESDRIREILALLQEAVPAVVETYGAEYWFAVKWRDGKSHAFYAGPDWIAPRQTGVQDAISGWRLRTQSFHAALTLEIGHQCFSPAT